MKESEVKARLAQAEAHFSHYRWDDAIAIFETVLANHPDHPLATQGWAHAVGQKSVDEELKEALAKARASLTADRFDEALALLNHAQTRGALSHILRHHSEIDGMRSEAQEGQEWQRRIEAAAREVEALAGRRRFDQALETLDETLRGLRARGWERLGAGLAAQREKLWAERDVSERVQFAQAAYERDDFALAAELADALFEELPGREDVRRLRERSRAASGRLQERLTAVNTALAEARAEDAQALLANLRAELPRNPDWQAIALRVYTEDGRAEFVKGRAALTQQAYEDAAEAFDAAQAAFATVAEIFPEHPTARHEGTEAAALRQTALAAGQAARDRAAYRWEASRQGWQAAREQLSGAVAARGREFSEVVAVVDAALAEVCAVLSDLEHARLMLADGRQALDARDAGGAREAFRAGLGRVEGGRLGDTAYLSELRDGLAAGLREAERIQRDVKKLLAQAEANHDARERVALLQRAYERWETAPGLTARLAEELLAAAQSSAEAGDEDAALAHCEQVAGLTGASAGALSDASRVAAEISARRAKQAAQAGAAKMAAQAEAIERALTPVEQELRTVDELCAPAADGELAAVDWDAADAALKSARKALRAARGAVQPLPLRWEELKARADGLERRNQLLRDLAERVAAGPGIHALPALRAFAAESGDPVALAALERLLREGSNDALVATREWLAQATAALERGELSTATSYIALAQNYEVGVPHVTPELRGVEQQVAVLTEARNRTRNARSLAAAGDCAAAMVEFQVALELMADGESRLPADARSDVLRVLGVMGSGTDEQLAPALLDGASHPLVREFVSPALRAWANLARQSAEARRAQTQAARWRRQLKRAWRLAELGEYAAALTELGAAGDGVTRWEAEAQDEALEQLADEVTDLRMALTKLQKLSEHLAPLLEQMREAALGGRFDAALAHREQAEFLDTRREATLMWMEFDALAGLIERRRTPDAGIAPSSPEGAEPRVASRLAPAPPTADVKAPSHLRSDAFSDANGEIRVARAPAAETSTRLPPEAAPEIPPHGPGTPAPVVQHFEEGERLDDPSPATIAPAIVVPLEPAEPAAPFDLDDWLSNVTELGLEDAGPGNES
jgi:hypothetical protein